MRRIGPKDFYRFYQLPPIPERNTSGEILFQKGSPGIWIPLLPLSILQGRYMGLGITGCLGNELIQSLKLPEILNKNTFREIPFDWMFRKSWESLRFQKNRNILKGEILYSSDFLVFSRSGNHFYFFLLIGPAGIK